MQGKIAFYNRTNVRILAMLIIFFAVTAVIVGTVNQNNIRRMIEETFTDRVLLSNALIANIVDSDEVEYYVELMRNQDDQFKQRQVEFFYNREKLFTLQEQEVSEDEMADLLDRLDVFHKEMNEFKTDRYWKTIEELRRLRDISHSAYVYVMADTGLFTSEGERLFTYIFDADDRLDYDDPIIDGLGTSYTGEDALEVVFSTGQQMEYVERYTGDYGELYFAYAPVLNDQGVVIAVVGTDLDLGIMNEEISRSILLFNSIFLAFSLIIVVLIYVYLTRSVTMPLGRLTETAHELSAGNVYASVPEIALKQRGEIGILAQAFNEMSGVYQDMISSTESLFSAANVGKLDIRNDSSKFKGDIQNVIKQINATLDATVLYLNSIPESIFIMNKDLEIYFQNEHFQKQFENASASEFLSFVFLQDEADVQDEESRENLLKEKVTLALDPELSSTTAWIKDRCYSVVLEEITLSEMTENSVLIIAIDITDLMTEKENAQSAARAKSEFLSRMSHEMRTPMNAIIGMTNIAANTDDVDRLRYCLATIGNSSEHLLSIINDVLDMAKIEAGKLELEYAPMNLDKMLTKVCTIVNEGIKRKNQTFNHTLSKDLPRDYIADDLRLSQVVTNLLSNAMKFTPEYGTITLTVEAIEQQDRQRDEPLDAQQLGGQPDGQLDAWQDEAQDDTTTLRFVVTDTGVGMTDEQLSRLFNAFEQADGGVSRKFGGTGLGLAISKSIIEKMGGRCWVESELNVGSAFSFEIPLKRVVQQDLATSSEVEAETSITNVDFSGIQVLLAEDVEINREILRALLEDTNISIDDAEDGRIAVSMFEADPEKYDLIIMDIQMPEMDGYQATHIIRSMDLPRARTIPIIAMTANAFKEDVDQCLESGMNDHLAKPIDVDAVIEKILRYTGKDQG